MSKIAQRLSFYDYQEELSWICRELDDPSFLFAQPIFYIACSSDNVFLFNCCCCLGAKSNIFYFFLASKWICSWWIDSVEEKCRQKIWRGGGVLHLLFHSTWVHLSNAKSWLSNLQKEISLGLSLQMVFNQSKFYLPPL